MPDTPYQPQQLAGACADCGRRYGDTFGFPDLCIDDEAWQKISPRDGHGGLLCPSCIIRRLVDAGIKCHGRFMSGPLYDAEEGKEAEINDLHAERDRLREAVSAFAQVCHNGGGEDCPECSLVMVCPRVHQDFKTARAALKHSSSAHGHFFDADDHIPCPEAKRCQLAMNPRPGEFCSGTTHSDGLCFVTNQKPDASTILAKPAGGKS